MNPSNVGKYWSGEHIEGSEGEYWLVGFDESGDIIDGIVAYNDDSSVGVRPFIEITI